MRIIQISDVHLNKENLNDLKDYYIDSLISDLKVAHSHKSIDVILFTGDLVDKGGASLGDNPYEIFDNNFIQPIINGVPISRERILMIPGNHDIDRRKIEEDSEFILIHKLDSDMANKRAEKFHVDFNNDNRRIENFKNFEKAFHSRTPNYKFSNNESLAIIHRDHQRFGFALVNDSWRCSSDLKREQHYIGYKQLFRARNYFSENKTDLNLAVFHHPLDAINENEREEIRNILRSKNFDVAIFGHSHRYESSRLLSSAGGFLSLNGRSAFSNPKELSSRFQSGYNILDLDSSNRSYTITARKFIYDGFRFDKDTDSLPNGEESNKLPLNDKRYALADDSNNEDNELPNSYTADVERIVSLLIGESIYPDRYVFVRELIQNSVDACNRIREKHTYLNPRIIINVNTPGNYIEVVDEGDGMTKHVIKNHFSVIGKSISQEYNDNVGKANLISKFGIGFISTFIVSEKILVTTKSEEDGQVIFEIEDVFKGFKYIEPSENEAIAKSGTSIRVYLKKGYQASLAYQHVLNYCRHIENLEINYDSSRVAVNEKWNISEEIQIYHDKNDRYEVRLGLSTNPMGVVASNSGFLITSYAGPILPFRFPSHIAGEINFFPKGIDFDVSRTNIITSDKSHSVRRDISSAVRFLFRKGLEGGGSKIAAILIGYLHYYLQYFDNDAAKMDESYKDFYSKKELISLCVDNSLVEYEKRLQKMGHVLSILKSKSIDKIYIINSNAVTDYQAIVIQFLESKGNLIIKSQTTNVNFASGQLQSVSLAAVVQIIASEHGLVVHDIGAVPSTLLSDMKLDKKRMPERLQRQLVKLQERFSKIIEVGMFSNSTRPSVSNGNEIFLNYNHSTFQSLLAEIDVLNDDTFEVYLLGILNLDLTGVGSSSQE